MQNDSQNATSDLYAIPWFWPILKLAKDIHKKKNPNLYAADQPTMSDESVKSLIGIPGIKSTSFEPISSEETAMLIDQAYELGGPDIEEVASLFLAPDGTGVKPPLEELVVPPTNNQPTKEYVVLNSQDFSPPTSGAMVVVFHPERVTSGDTGIVVYFQPDTGGPATVLGTIPLELAQNFGNFESVELTMSSLKVQDVTATEFRTGTQTGGIVSLQFNKDFADYTPTDIISGAIERKAVVTGVKSADPDNGIVIVDGMRFDRDEAVDLNGEQSAGWNKQVRKSVVIRNVTIDQDYANGAPANTQLVAYDPADTTKGYFFVSKNGFQMVFGPGATPCQNVNYPVNPPGGIGEDPSFKNCFKAHVAHKTTLFNTTVGAESWALVAYDRDDNELDRETFYGSNDGQIYTTYEGEAMLMSKAAPIDYITAEVTFSGGVPALLQTFQEGYTNITWLYPFTDAPEFPVQVIRCSDIPADGSISVVAKFYLTVTVVSAAQSLLRPAVKKHLSNPERRELIRQIALVQPPVRTFKAQGLINQALTNNPEVAGRLVAASGSKTGGGRLAKWLTKFFKLLNRGERFVEQNPEIQSAFSRLRGKYAADDEYEEMYEEPRAAASPRHAAAPRRYASSGTRFRRAAATTRRFASSKPSEDLVDWSKINQDEETESAPVYPVAVEEFDVEEVNPGWFGFGKKKLKTTPKEQPQVVPIHPKAKQPMNMSMIKGNLRMGGFREADWKPAYEEAQAAIERLVYEMNSSGSDLEEIGIAVAENDEVKAFVELVNATGYIETSPELLGLAVANELAAKADLLQKVNNALMASSTRKEVARVEKLMRRPQHYPTRARGWAIFPALSQVTRGGKTTFVRGADVLQKIFVTDHRVPGHEYHDGGVIHIDSNFQDTSKTLLSILYQLLEWSPDKEWYITSDVAGDKVFGNSWELAAIYAALGLNGLIATGTAGSVNAAGKDEIEIAPGDISHFDVKAAATTEQMHSPNNPDNPLRVITVFKPPKRSSFPGFSVLIEEGKKNKVLHGLGKSTSRVNVLVENPNLAGRSFYASKWRSTIAQQERLADEQREKARSLPQGPGKKVTKNEQWMAALASQMNDDEIEDAEALIDQIQSGMVALYTIFADSQARAGMPVPRTTPDLELENAWLSSLVGTILSGEAETPGTVEFKEAVVNTWKNYVKGEFLNDLRLLPIASFTGRRGPTDLETPYLRRYGAEGYSAASPEDKQVILASVAAGEGFPMEFAQPPSGGPRRKGRLARARAKFGEGTSTG